jgi:hypothetical protein
LAEVREAPELDLRMNRTHAARGEGECNANWGVKTGLTAQLHRLWDHQDLLTSCVNLMVLHTLSLSLPKPMVIRHFTGVTRRFDEME